MPIKTGPSKGSKLFKLYGNNEDPIRGDEEEELDPETTN